MKTLSIEIADNVYSEFLNFLKILPKESFVVVEEDDDELTAEESKEVYRMKKKTDKGDFSEFDDWDKIKGNL